MKSGSAHSWGWNEGVNHPHPSPLPGRERGKKGKGLAFAEDFSQAGLDEAPGVLPVHGGAALDDFEVFVLQGVDLAGDADDHGVGGHVGVRKDDGACTDDAVVIYLGVFKQDCIDTNHDFVADPVTVEDSAVSDDDVVADYKVVVGVEDAVVLDVGVASDADAAIVAAQDGAGPDAGVFAYVDVSDYVGGLANEGGGVDGGGEPVEASNHGDERAAFGVCIWK